MYHLIISLDDYFVRYLLVTQNSEGLYHITHYDKSPLPQGVVVDGLPVQATVLTDIFSVIYQQITKEIKKPDHVSLLIPYPYFDHHSFPLEQKIHSKNLSKKIDRYVEKNLLEDEQYQWIQTHQSHLHFDLRTKEVYAHALPSNYAESYRMLLDQVGFSHVGMFSTTYASEYLVPQTDVAYMIFVGQEHSYVHRYDDGHYQDTVSFDASYQSFLSEIKRYIPNTDESQSRSIFKDHGVSRSHKNPELYKKLHGILQPLRDYLQKQLRKEPGEVYVWFLDTPIIGYVDDLETSLKTSITTAEDLLRSQYPLTRVLSVHRDELHRYSPLFAHGVVMSELFKKK